MDADQLEPDHQRNSYHGCVMYVPTVNEEDAVESLEIYNDTLKMISSLEAEKSSMEDIARYVAKIKAHLMLIYNLGHD